MTTTAPAGVQLCAHLEAGRTHSYIERGDHRYCLDCAAEIYLKTHDPRLVGIYLQVSEARAQRASSRI